MIFKRIRDFSSRCWVNGAVKDAILGGFLHFFLRELLEDFFQPVMQVKEPKGSVVEFFQSFRTFSMTLK